MTTIKAKLSVFTEAELLEELVRRANNTEMVDIKQWCEDCDHFKPWPAKHIAHMSDDYNPCKKKHEMKLYVPQDHEGPDGGGFYRPVCPDRQEKQ
jgi:quinolinate synthase